VQLNLTVGTGLFAFFGLVFLLYRGPERILGLPHWLYGLAFAALACAFGVCVWGLCGLFVIDANRQVLSAIRELSCWGAHAYGALVHSRYHSLRTAQCECW
jgi:hypothetical protein